MGWKQVVAGIAIGAILAIGGTLLWLQVRQHHWPLSPDGKYEAVRVASRGSAHYRVKEIATGRIVLTTHAQHSWPNDVKAGRFSPDSKEIAAAYCYAHEGKYTWVGIWNIQTGNLVDTKRPHGWTDDIHWIFDKDSQ